MLTALGRRVERWVDASDPFTNVYGLARSLLALAGAATLIVNASTTLFFPIPSAPDVPMCAGVRSAGLFCVASGHLDAARWLGALALLLVASGWRPRFTGVLHAWVAFSLQGNATAIEGGDQIACILSLLLVPVTLVDDRRSHWSARPALVGPPSERERARRLVAKICFTLIRIQVAGIYFHAAVGKFKVPEWTDGTVIYYWLTHQTFGAPAWIAPLVRPIVLSPLVAVITWGVLVLESALAAGLVAKARYRPYLLAAGLALHGGITLLHGLVSFGLVMFAALVLFLRPLDRPLAPPTLARRAWAGLVRAIRTRVPERARALARAGDASDRDRGRLSA